MRRALGIAALGVVAEIVQGAFWVTTAFMHESVSINTDAWMMFTAGFGLMALPVGFAACYVRQVDVAFTAAILTAIATGIVLILFWRDPRTALEADATATTIVLVVLGLAPSATLAALAFGVRAHRPSSSNAAHA